MFKQITEMLIPSLNNLLNFVPENYIEESIFNSINKNVLKIYLNYTIQPYSEGQFYLGGQIKMRPDQEITLEKINEVREIEKQRMIDYGGPCNSFEMASINNHKNLLLQMEELIKAYTRIGYLRELDKVINVSDVNSLIASFAI